MSTFRSSTRGSFQDIIEVCKQDLKLENPTLVSPIVPASATPTVPSLLDMQADAFSFYGVNGKDTFMDDMWDGAAKVNSVNCNIYENGIEHRTFYYDTMKNYTSSHLVVRRGMYFSVSVEFSRHLDRSRDKLGLTFYLKDCPHPKIGNGTKVVIPVAFRPPVVKTTQTWVAYCESYSVGNSIKLFVCPSPSAIVHIWKMVIHSEYQELKRSYNCSGDLYVLFNVWCPDDEVYVNQEENRNEYVLNDAGLVFKGTPTSYDKSVWKYGQFDKHVLECSLVLMTEIAQVPFSQCSSVLQVAIGIKKALASPRFIGPPTAKKKFCSLRKKETIKINGSRRALQTFFKTGIPIKNPPHLLKVGIIVTVLRSLGISSRLVSSFRFLNSLDPPSPIDYYYSEKGQDPFRGTDLIKDYSEWAEVHIVRPDLKEPCIWNYLDETYGPTPTEAIKNGLTYVQFDTAVLIKSLGADISYWKVLDDGKPPKLIKKCENWICPKIVTKKIGAWDDDDITTAYKKPKVPQEKKLRQSSSDPGSSSKIAGFLCGTVDKSQDDTSRKLPLNDILVEINPENSNGYILYGNTYKIEASLTNKSYEDCTVALNWQVWTRKPHATKMLLVKKSAKTLELKTDDIEKHDFQLHYEDYVNVKSETSIYYVLCTANVSNVNQDILLETEFRIRAPDLSCKILGDLEMYKKSLIELYITNSTPTTIENRKIYLSECDGKKKVSVKIPSARPYQRSCARFKVVPYFLGRFTLTATTGGEDHIESCSFMDVVVTK